MLDSKEVSWLVAIGRAVISIVVLTGAFVGIDLMIYLDSANSALNVEVKSAFDQAYDYGYAQTFDVAYRSALDESFDKGYSKGYEISRNSASGGVVSRLVETHYPTYSEMMSFLLEDRTNEKAYVEGEYVCFDYAAELNNNADAKGIQVAYVRLRAADWGHAVVAFQTRDKGLVYVEPQSDSVVKLVPGQPYPWHEAGAASPFTASDPILEIELVW